MLQTKDPATAQMNEWFNGSKDSSPFVRSAKMTVHTDISSVLPISATSWQVDWQETTRDRDGSLIGKPVHMRATVESTSYLEHARARERHPAQPAWDLRPRFPLAGGLRMKTLLFFLLALTCLSALAERRYHPFHWLLEKGLLRPQPLKQLRRRRGLHRRFRRLRLRRFRRRRQHRRLPPPNPVSSIRACLGGNNPVLTDKRGPA